MNVEPNQPASNPEQHLTSNCRVWDNQFQQRTLERTNQGY